jgi:cell division protein FtsL
VTKDQRLHRETDPRVRRSLAAALACLALVVVVGLGLVGLRVHQVQLAYRLDALRAERERSERLIRQLEIEVATLRSPVRLESRARQLGLTAPTQQQVQLAREFVPAGTGTAAAARVAGREALVR